MRAVFEALDEKHNIVVCGADEHIRIRKGEGTLVECLQRLADINESLEKSLVL